MSLRLLKKSLVGLSGYFEDHEKNNSDKQVTPSSLPKESVILQEKSHLTRKYGRRSIQRKRIIAAQRGHRRKVQKIGRTIFPFSCFSRSSNCISEPITIPTLLSK
jgi:hypothetical protein